MLHVADFTAFLEQFAPARLAEAWDNVGLLVGNAEQAVERVMTCLTITPDSVAEAVAERADLIVTHHPLPFQPLRRLTADTVEGRLLLDLIGARIAVYSPHTAFDSAAAGINQRLAVGIGLSDVVPLQADLQDPTAGTGRRGFPAAPRSLAELAGEVARFLSLEGVQVVGQPQWPVRNVAVCCGSAGELMAAAQAAGCDCIVTGESRFHAVLEAEALGMALVLTGHYASERFAVESLAHLLAARFPVVVWASRREHDPLRWVATTCPST